MNPFNYLSICKLIVCFDCAVETYTVEYLPKILRKFSTDNNYYVSGQSLKMSATRHTRGCGRSLTVRVASTRLSAKHCKIQADKVVRPQCQKIS